MTQLSKGYNNSTTTRLRSTDSRLVGQVCEIYKQELARNIEQCGVLGTLLGQANYVRCCRDTGNSCDEAGPSQSSTARPGPAELDHHHSIRSSSVALRCKPRDDAAWWCEEKVHNGRSGSIEAVLMRQHAARGGFSRFERARQGACAPSLWLLATPMRMRRSI